ncbi:hypothetical protein JOB18_039200 [Solea senegalensis]|uniref:Uncharacterized protein n=1 Tax=Solea senegalensis TaxID=28829 RepID=A0AAV6R9A8_SOLSE|nr:hypothetical protein JOB18_039200 [Solea senegalensis]
MEEEKKKDEEKKEEKEEETKEEGSPENPAREKSGIPEKQTWWNRVGTVITQRS